MQAMDHQRGLKRKQLAESMNDAALIEMLSNEILRIKQDNGSFLTKITRWLGGDRGEAPVSGYELNRLNNVIGAPSNTQAEEEKLYYVDPDKLEGMINRVPSNNPQRQ